METVQNENSFETERIINKVNETNLERITIKGLFGRYNIDIPFDKQVNIFVGENGMGKTTILNCIYFILDQNFHRLVNIHFSEIIVKFKNDPKKYKVTIEDIEEYNRKSKTGIWYKHSNGPDDDMQNMIDSILYRYGNSTYINDDDDVERMLVYELVNRFDISISVARNQVKYYLSGREMLKINKNRNKGDKNNVLELIKAIEKNVKHRIIYLPTYRRIEDDFASLNIGMEKLNKADLLIRFGMSDVQKSIEGILENIRSDAMKGFTEMTGILLKQYVDGEDPLMERFSETAYTDINYETVKIVLDRVGKGIDNDYKEKILNLVNSKERRQYAYLWNLINKLIDNYKKQRVYDERIKKFADTCNKYLINKHFNYNQSTLNLDIFLDNIFADNKKETIQLTQLSSGEKQIVSLFSKLYLELYSESDQKNIVIIDEPELSLSIGWQQMLLPDIMRTENCDLLITVTHSPFIFENEFDSDARAIREFMEIYK